MRNGSLLHRVWLWYAELQTYQGQNMWVWRWICWKDRGHDDYYGICVVCGKPLPANYMHDLRARRAA